MILKIMNYILIFQYKKMSLKNKNEGYAGLNRNHFINIIKYYE